MATLYDRAPLIIIPEIMLDLHRNSIRELFLSEKYYFEPLGGQVYPQNTWILMVKIRFILLSKKGLEAIGSASFPYSGA